MLGSSPLPVLAHLADDEKFRGLALVEVAPHLLFDAARFSDQTPRTYPAHSLR